MSHTLRLVQESVTRREVKISAHGYDELVADSILVKDILAGVQDAGVVEDNVVTAYRPDPDQWTSDFLRRTV